MKLTRLRLVGFKTFVEPTDFLIEPGLTGIVGPNGCGKSNLVEALRWVMGESSHKSMRASGMDDVIFSGSGSRPGAQHRRGRAARSTTPTARAPAAFNDADALEISRRIEREQGSTYRINGREVRARDVQLLFADAATGARSPALVRQGQISEIIAAKPQARRRILEDAAGIAGLHSRRHEAELRLQAAEDNLMRVEDVLQRDRGADREPEAARRRQAARYRLSAEIRRLEALLLAIGWPRRASSAPRPSAGAADLRPSPSARAAQAAAATAPGRRRPRAAGPARGRGVGRRGAAAADAWPATSSTPRRGAPASASPSSSAGSPSSRRDLAREARADRRTPRPPWRASTAEEAELGREPTGADDGRAEARGARCARPRPCSPTPRPRWRAAPGRGADLNARRAAARARRARGDGARRPVRRRDRPRVERDLARPRARAGRRRLARDLRAEVACRRGRGRRRRDERRRRRAGRPCRRPRGRSSARASRHARPSGGPAPRDRGAHAGQALRPAERGDLWPPALDADHRRARATRRRSAPPSATTSTPRPTSPRRPTGPRPAPARAIRPCPTARSPLADFVEAPGRAAAPPAPDRPRRRAPRASACATS